MIEQFRGESLGDRLDYRPGSLPRCGRVTLTGEPCKALRMTLPGCYVGRSPRLVVAVEHAGYLPPACRMHATSAERAEHGQICDFTRAVIAEAESAHWRAQPIRCHAWEVTSEHRASAAEIAACPDETEAFRMAERLLLDWQNGRCAVCGDRLRALDHDHETALIRGYLCRFCNAGEGRGGYEPEHPFSRYRERNPAIILGIRVRYWSAWEGWAEPETADPSGAELAAILAALDLPDLGTGDRGRVRQELE